MEKVYLLYEYDGICYSVIGVFSSEELAEKRSDELYENNCSHRYVDEVEVNSDIRG